VHEAYFNNESVDDMKSVATLYPPIVENSRSMMLVSKPVGEERRTESSYTDVIAEKEVTLPT